MKSLTVWELKRTRIYHDIYSQIRENPRITYKEMAINKGVGRGKRHSTYSQHYSNMKSRMISRDPIAILKPSERYQTNAYLCKNKNGCKRGEKYEKLKKNKDINFIMFLLGDLDFLITSRKDIDLSSYNLDVVKTKMYAPIFTEPRGWDKEIEETFKDMINSDFEKGNLTREKLRLDWTELDWTIYREMKGNIRRSFKDVSKITDVYRQTVKSHFFDIVLPHCVICHYFFPRGYDYYRQTFLRIQSNYEKDLINAFSKLSTTTYVYPLGNELNVVAFHDNSNKFLKNIQKLEEKGIIENYYVSVPLESTFIF